MNTPGMGTGNWSWRLAAGAADDELAARLREAAEAAGRA
jgi:4-alpha-glucanotransferase